MFLQKTKSRYALRSAEKYSLDLTKCYLIGDDDRDIVAGEAAGCICRMVDEKYTVLATVKEIIALDKKGEDT